MSRHDSRNCFAAAAATALLTAGHAQAALTATVSTDLPAARSAFLAQATVLGAYDWSSKFAANTHTVGNLGAVINATTQSFTASDGANNTISGSVGALALGNWVDGTGFNAPNSSNAAADLALNGAESFNLAFQNAYRSVGMAVITGKSNFPADVDLLGASFEFTALNAQGASLGTAQLVLPAGAPAAAWVTLVSSAPIFGLQVREVGAVTIKDQYFSNIYATPATVSAVPEPGTWLMMAMGLAGLGRISQSSRYARMRASTRSTIKPL